MGQLSILDYIIYSLMPFGQLLARINNYNGSLDAWWLLLIPIFYIPVLGIIPLLLMTFLKISDGNVRTSVIDKYLFLPIMFKFYSPYIFSLIGMDPHTYQYAFVTFIIQVILGMLSNISRRSSMCPGDLTVNALGKTFMDAAIANNIGELFVYIFTKLPGLNSMNDNSNISINLISIYWSIGYAFTYIINNMYNEYNAKNYCGLSFLGNAQDMFLFMGSIFIVILVKYNYLFSGITPNKTAPDTFQFSNVNW